VIITYYNEHEGGGRVYTCVGNFFLMFFFSVCGGEIGLTVYKSHSMCSQCVQVLLIF